MKSLHALYKTGLNENRIKEEKKFYLFYIYSIYNFWHIIYIIYRLKERA